MIADQHAEPRSARERVAALVRDGPFALAPDQLAAPNRTVVPGSFVASESTVASSRLAAPDPRVAPGWLIAADPPTTPLPAVRPAGRFASWAQRWLPAWLPGWLRGARFDPGHRGALGLALVTATAAVLAAVGVWRDRPVVEPAPPLAAVPAAVDRVEPGSARDAAATAALVISVVGKVARPGVVRVPDGARVADVLDAAGGALPGTDVVALNLARKVADGEQVVVGLPQPVDPAGAAAGAAGSGTAGSGAAGSGAAGSSAAGAGASALGPGGRVDLNSATLQQLDGLPGIGPVTAQRIIDWRTQHGRFGRVEQLREVDGIGERRFAQLRNLVTV